MKKQGMAAAALCISLLLGGCGNTADTPAEESDAEQAHLETIASLEAALQEERQRLYQSEVRHKAELLALQQRLDALNSNAGAEQDKVEELIFRYRLEGDGAVITGFQGGGALLNIPAALDGHPVVGIGERAFEGSDIVGVVLPDGITTVGWFAFYGCTKLSHVTLPASVSSIGYAVFDGCKTITIFCPGGSYAEAYAKSYGFCVFTT